MKQQRSIAGYGLALLTLISAALLLTGCQTPKFEPLPGDVPDPAAKMGTADPFHVGDQVNITFSSASPELILPPIREAVKEDGTITVPLLGKVTANGKTPGQLQTELQKEFGKYYKNFNVTVLPADRFYYVSGEVKRPGPEPYLGVTDIIKAISAAGDFTDFARKKKVLLTRASGQKEIINVQKIINGGAEDVPIYPGDKIVVKRRLF
jgi:protein involved in polysaccharide export with SLBB domain